MSYHMGDSTRLLAPVCATSSASDNGPESGHGSLNRWLGSGTVWTAHRQGPVRTFSCPVLTAPGKPTACVWTSSRARAPNLSAVPGQAVSWRRRNAPKWLEVLAWPCRIAPLPLLEAGSTWEDC